MHLNLIYCNSFLMRVDAIIEYILFLQMQIDLEENGEERDTIADQRRHLDDDNQVRAHQHPRVNISFVMPRHVDTNSASAASIRRTTIVNLSSLTHLDAEPSLWQAIIIQILRIIAHNPHI